MWKQNDVSGRCTVQYKAAKGQVTRTKNLETCKTTETGFTTHSKVSPLSRPAHTALMLILVRH